MSDPSSNQPRPRRRRRHVLATLAGLALVGVVGSEAFLRLRYGLGDVPRIQTDPTMEYRYAPNGHYVRLGHHIDVNAWSMRSDDFPEHKSAPDERRVLVIGDSVVNGGAHNDQSQIATSLLQSQLRIDLKTDHVIVGNISAGSWGPQNELAYVDRFGLFDADVCAVIVSSHDATDEIGPLPRDVHLKTPTYHSAWSEVIARLFTHGVNDNDPANDPPGHAEPCLAAFDTLLTKIESATGRKAIVLFHYEKAEVDLADEPKGMTLFRAVCTRHGIRPIPLNAAYRAAQADGTNLYLDVIHPDAAGHRVIASVLTPLVEAALAQPSTRPTATTEANR